MKRGWPVFPTVSLYLLALAYTLPLLWLVATAFQADANVFRLPTMHRWTFSNFIALSHETEAGRWLANSLFLASAQCVLTVPVSAAAGFALAKYRFVGRRFSEYLLLGSLLLPSQLLLPATYELIVHLGLNNTYAAILLPGTLSVLGIFLMRQACVAVPDELLDAGRIDGCSELRLWWTVALPIMRPMTAAVTLLIFLASWNSFLWPQVVLQDSAKLTLPLGIANLSGLAQMQLHPALLMAVALLGVVPPMLLFFALQRDFVQGLADGTLR